MNKMYIFNTPIVELKSNKTYKNNPKNIKKRKNITKVKV